MKRTVIEIDRDKCVGCTLCASTCHQGAIQMVDGKAMLISDDYCDGLGRCLPSCPVSAITLIEKDVPEFSEKHDVKTACGSDIVSEPVKLNDQIKTSQNNTTNIATFDINHSGIDTSGFSVGGAKIGNTDKSSISQAPTSSRGFSMQPSHKPPINFGGAFWPIQLRLVNPKAGFLQGADLLLAADCSAFVHKNFREEITKDKVTIIFCPKLDDNKYHQEKLHEIIASNDIKSITVVKMVVPCCNGTSIAAKAAIMQSGKNIPYNEIVLGVDGSVL